MRIKFSLVFLIALYCLPTWCQAELQPAEVAIVTARGNRESEELARYYARVRNIPADNICLVDVPAGEVCPREQWQVSIRPEIHKWLVEKDPQQKIRCLVTLWGIPLKIAPAAKDAQLQRYQQFLEAERSQRLALLGKVVDRFEGVAKDAPGAGAPKASAADGEKPKGAAGDAADTDLARLQTRLETALQAAQTRAIKLTHELERNAANAELQQLATAAGGLNVLMAALNQQAKSADSPNAAARSEFDAIRGRLMSYSESRALVDQMPPGIERDAVELALVERTGGLMATVQWLDQELEMVRKNETGASFDSELTLVMWPHDYELLRWQPSYLRPGYANSQLPKAFRTLMVSRIDAPTLKLAKGMVDTAIAVEKSGLHGTAYFDARGLAKIDDPNVAPGSYPDYDRSLLLLAKSMNEQTNIKVVLENTPQLFQPGQCKDAALYCGWYSLGKYIDAFEWVPGAVGYHLASSEASTIRDPNSQVWCKKMLEHGVCATIGPVYEPYLAAFPRPDEFFTLLLRGELTLAECYAQTNPYNSWMMVLFGDPLYRPFKYRAAEAASKTPAAAAAAVPPAPAAGDSK
ncbi:MAG TPA: TIGR03790 family protein [Lacipirellulaceae bacterium]|nr:TIGR03790 family protein [Lacipirellulaceae bacterium]